jgi:hypothetical protein
MIYSHFSRSAPIKRTYALLFCSVSQDERAGPSELVPPKQTNLNENVTTLITLISSLLVYHPMMVFVFYIRAPAVGLYRYFVLR